MYVLLLVPATMLLVIWFGLFFFATDEDWIAAAQGKILENREQISKLMQKDIVNQKKRSECTQGAMKALAPILYGDSAKKEIERLRLQNRELQGGNLKHIGIFLIPGYVLQRSVQAIGRGNFHKKITEQCVELHGKKYGAVWANNELAQILSFPILGFGLILAFGMLFLSTGNKELGLILMIGGSLVLSVLVYMIYDDVKDRINKRRAAISRQFPNVVSKLALLVTSGMIMDRAWRETAESSDRELYQEMRKTADELDNLVPPAEAYSNFILRCSTKETTKLASAIIQNLTMGNEQIGALLKTMSHEAWMDRRHTAKKDSEAANSKLMIPSMLVFAMILVILLVPVLLNFSSV